MAKSHFRTRHTTRYTVRKVGHDWLDLNAQMGEQANKWANRNDLIAHIGPDGGKDPKTGQELAAALFNPQTAELDVNTSVAFGEFVEPSLVGDFTLRPTHFEWPKAAGFLQHEASHARWSTADFEYIYDELDPQEFDAYTLLEESRIEGCAVEVYPTNKPFLRSSAMTLVHNDSTPEEDEKLAAMSPVTLAVRLSALALARVDAGVLDKSDVVNIRKQVNKVIKPEIRKKMRVIWRKFQASDDRVDLDDMMQLARDWMALVKEVRKDNGEPEDGPKQEGGAGSDGEGGAGEGELTPEQMDALAEMLGAMEEDQNSADHDGVREARNQQKTEARQASAKAKQGANEEWQENLKQSKNTFERSSGPNGTHSHSRVYNRRQPTSAERVAANRISRAMEKAKYRDRIRLEMDTALPPGRLRVGSAIQGAAIRQNGGTDSSTPWNKVVRHHVDDPKLTMGLMCDISGSMGGTMPAMAVAAWVMSEAVRRIQGTAAAVYYGNDVFSVLKPGEHLPEITEYTADDGTEEFDTAFRSLDGALNLINGDGARLLVICSDGNYRSDIEPRALYWLDRCRQAGVGVVWIGLKSGRAQSFCEQTGAQFVHAGSDVVSASNMIGAAATKALTAAGKTRGA